MSNVARLKPADAVAHALGIREEVLDAKGPRHEGPKVQVFHFTGMEVK